MPTLPLLVWDRHVGLGAEMGIAVSGMATVACTTGVVGLSLCGAGLTVRSL